MNQKQSFGQPAQSAASGRTERVRVESDLTRVARSSVGLDTSFRRPPAGRASASVQNHRSPLDSSIFVWSYEGCPARGRYGPFA